MTVTLAASEASSTRVNPPGPGPTSTMCRPAREPALRTMRAVRFASSRKCCPSARRADRPCRAITSRSGGSAFIPAEESRAPRAYFDRCVAAQVSLKLARQQFHALVEQLRLHLLLVHLRQVLLLARADNDDSDAIARHQRLAGAIQRQAGKQLAECRRCNAF